jgi:hypothetical protein
MNVIRQIRRGLGVGALSTLVALASAVLPSAAVSAGTVEGMIGSLSQRAADGLIVVYINGANSGRAACAAGHVYWLVKDENSNVDKGHYAMLLAAKLAGKTVRVVGLNTCTRWGDGEDINYIEILD